MADIYILKILEDYINLNNLMTLDVILCDKMGELLAEFYLWSISSFNDYASTIYFLLGYSSFAILTTNNYNPWIVVYY